MNLLLVSVDSLRLDSVSRTNRRIRTPRFDRCSSDFCFYDRLFSASSATRPVHCSLFTGLYPFEHGVEGQQYPRMKDGLPSLLDLFARAGYRVGFYSQAPEIFYGLDWGAEPIANLERFMAADRGEPRFLFLHYWHTHAPYGASDNLAHGQTLELLRRGELPAVRSQYEAAVQRVFEYSVARVLENLDLKRWCVLIFGDHGESWTRDEPYHGLTLRNSVLRVPLYFHIPNSGNPRPPRQLLSIVDLFPTLIDLFQLPIQYRGFGRDLRQEQSPDYYAAQIDPVANEVAGEDDPGRLLVGGGGRGRQWALFNPQVKMTYFEESKQTCLERTFDEQPIADGKLLLQMQEVYRDMNRDSAYADQTSPTSTEDEESMLEQRLRDLGYLA